MPQDPQRVLLWITIVLATAVTLSALRMSVKERSATPLLMVIGAFAAILLEPVVTFLGHAIHPQIGQISLFEALDRPIPWHIALGYVAAFGIFYLVLHSKWLRGRLTKGVIVKVTLVTALCYYIGEAYPVEHGLWGYYDYQPLWIWKGTAPPTWSVLNATSMLMSYTLMVIALPHLRGVSRLLLPPLAVSGAFMGHMGAGFPMYNAINSDAPHWLMQISGVASIVMALIIVWLCTILLTRNPSGKAGCASPS